MRTETCKTCKASLESVRPLAAQGNSGGVHFTYRCPHCGGYTHIRRTKN